jgi:25/26-hydroxycholesterol 7alpha-hydroxylase
MAMAIWEMLQTHQILSTIGILLIFAYTYHLVLVHPDPSEPPLIKGYIPFLGAIPQAILSPFTFLTSLKQQYGDIFTIYALGQRVTIVCDPISGIPAVFKKAKQLSFKAGLQTVYVKGLGFSKERCNQEAMDKEHFAMIPPYLLATSAVDDLTKRFIKFLLENLRDQVQENPEFEVGKMVDLFDWAGARLFFSSGPALYGEGVFDNADTILDDFRVFDDGFALRIMLPLWMTQWVARARSRIHDVLCSYLSKGLNDPSEFVTKRIEVYSCVLSANHVDSKEIWIRYGQHWKRHSRNYICLNGNTTPSN